MTRPDSPGTARHGTARHGTTVCIVTEHDAVSDPTGRRGRVPRPAAASAARILLSMQPDSTCGRVFETLSTPYNKLATPDTASVDVAHAAARIQFD
jgi:hypothetical protein